MGTLTSQGHDCCTCNIRLLGPPRWTRTHTDAHTQFVSLGGFFATGLRSEPDVNVHLILLPNKTWNHPLL